MRAVYVDFRMFQNPREVHAFLKGQMNFPDFYGMNLDALFDCLTERSEETYILYRTSGQPFERGFLQVFADAAAMNPRIISEEFIR